MGECPTAESRRVRHVSDTELLPKSKPEPVRRLEVFTGAGRRRAWSAEQKAQILAESYESGEKVSAIARRHGLTPQQLFGWRRDERRQAARRQVSDARAPRSSAFAPVIVEAALPSPADVPIAPERIGRAVMIEIVIGAATVRVSLGIDAATLTTVLRAVRAAT
jgi:transposase